MKNGMIGLSWHLHIHKIIFILLSHVHGHYPPLLQAPGLAVLALAPAIGPGPLPGVVFLPISPVHVHGIVQESDGSDFLNLNLHLS